MSLPGGLSRRKMLLKIAMLFNGVVGVLLGIPIVRYIFSPVTKGRKPGYDSLVSLGPSISSPPAKRVSRLTVTRSRMPLDGETADSPAGCATLRANIFRSSQSIAHTWDVQCVGSLNPACSCVHATAAPTMPTDRAHPAHRSAGYSSTHSGFSTEN